VTELKQPFAIGILTWFAALVSAGMFLSILLAIYGIGPAIIGGERVTRTEWLHIATPLVAVIGILMALVSYAFVSQNPWSRHLVITMFVFGAASVWYFYIKPNVAAYFRELRDRHSLLSERSLGAP
jgi:hypothetical protein